MKKLLSIGLGIGLGFSAFADAFSVTWTPNVTLTIPWTNSTTPTAYGTSVGINLVPVPGKLTSLIVSSSGSATNGWLYFADAPASNGVQYSTSRLNWTNSSTYVTYLTYSTNWTQVTNTYSTSGTFGSGGTNAFQTNYISGMFTYAYTNAIATNAYKLLYAVYIPSNSVVSIAVPTAGQELGQGLVVASTNTVPFGISGTFSSSR